MRSSLDLDSIVCVGEWGAGPLVGRIEVLCTSTNRYAIPDYVLLPVIDKHCLDNSLGNSLGLQMGAL